MDGTLLAERRSIALIIDDYPAHTHIENLKSNKLFFYHQTQHQQPQPMDQDVIRSVKA